MTITIDIHRLGVTIWELLTYGKKPYGNIPHTDVPELLEKGERLPQPRIATMEVYKTILSCWFLSPESRPTFQELVQEFKRMVPNSQSYLMISDELLAEPDVSLDYLNGTCARHHRRKRSTNLGGGVVTDILRII